MLFDLPLDISGLKAICLGYFFILFVGRGGINDDRLGICMKRGLPTIKVHNGFLPLKQIAPWIIIFVGFCLGWWIPLSQDVIWLVHCAQTWMAGGTPFSVDFEELNPPFNVALYLPLAWLVNHSFLSAAQTVSVAVWIVMVGIYKLISTQLNNQAKKGLLETTVAQNLRIGTAIALFLMPAPEIGQREHFLLAFTLPYVILVAGQIQGMSVGLRHQLPIAGLAGLGFIIKPQTLIVPVLIELFFAFQQRRFVTLLNPRSIVMAAVCLGYGFWIYSAFPAYITFYGPMLMDVYGRFGVNDARIYMGLFCSLGVVLFSGLYALQAFRHGDFKPMQGVWLLSGLGFLIVVLWQGKFFLYHLFPFLGVMLMFLGSFRIQRDRLVLVLVLVCVCVLFYAHSGSYALSQVTKGIWDDLGQKTSVRRIAILSPQSFVSESLLEQSSLVYGSRYMSLWFTPWVLDSQTQRTSTQSKVFESYFLKAVGADMNYYKPHLVILQRTENNMLLAWLRRDPVFQKEWEDFVPLQGHFGTFNKVFAIYIHRDVPEPDQVARTLEKTLKGFPE